MDDNILQGNINRSFMCMVFLASCVFLGIFYYQPHLLISHSILLVNTEEEIAYHLGGKFLVYNQKCRMPELDPFNPEVRLFYKKETYKPCTKNKLLTGVKKLDRFTAIVYIDKKAIASYTKNDVICSYCNVTRKDDKKNPDGAISISNCIDFKQHVTLEEYPILVHCNDTKTGKRLYDNVHAAITTTDQVTEKILAHNETIPETRPLSVLFIGIDSISRLNMMRALPKTRQHLIDKNWLEIKAYNKMGDNTFPNLMAILTGRNESNAYAVCNPKELGNLDKCNFVWKDYDKFGYITGYGEDAGDISTFNYRKKGFVSKPMDYYFRSYILAAEKLKTVRVDGIVYCAGPETEGERILNLATDFATSLQGLPSFGFFWMNTYSHNELNSPTRFDEIVLKFFKGLGKDKKTLEDTVVIFISDHGLRFGEIRYTRTGWLEERLPFFFISLPEWFKTQNPTAYQNLQANSDRLSTPYDLHLTLQDILIQSGHNHTLTPSTGCPTCQSLFEPLPEVRSCEEANVDIHWCTCTGYKHLSPSNRTVLAASEFIIGEIHGMIELYPREEAKKCAKYSVSKVMSSSVSMVYDDWYKNSTYLLVVLRAKPEAVFEATLKVEDIGDEKTKFMMQGGVSRLDTYGPHSKCVKDGGLKKYCHC